MTLSFQTRSSGRPLEGVGKSEEEVSLRGARTPTPLPGECLSSERTPWKTHRSNRTRRTHVSTRVLYKIWVGCSRFVTSFPRRTRGETQEGGGRGSGTGGRRGPGVGRGAPCVTGGVSRGGGRRTGTGPGARRRRPTTTGAPGAGPGLQPATVSARTYVSTSRFQSESERGDRKEMGRDL